MEKDGNQFMVKNSFRFAAALLLLAPVYAADFEVKWEATATQIILKYRPPAGGSCTVQLSESPTFSPLVNDVNPSLFSGSNGDASALDVSGERWLVVGHRTVELASDGKFYSRALQSNTPHFAQINCGGLIGQESPVTKNPALASPPETPLFDSRRFGNYAQPTFDFQNQAKTYIEPQTGTLIKRVTTPGDVGDNTNNSFVTQNVSFQSALDRNGVWTNLSAILGTTGFASYSGTGTSSDYVFLTAPISTGGLPGYSTFLAILDMRVRLNGSGTGSTPADNALSGCLSTDGGQTCATAQIDFPAFPTGTAATQTFPPAYPAPIFSQWLTAGIDPPPTPSIQTRRGTVDVTGNVNVALSGGASFADMVPGDSIIIAGSGCATGDRCLVASVVDAGHLTLSTISANVAGATYTANNFGLKIWKKTGTGTINVNSAKFDWTWDATWTMPAGGGSDACSLQPAPTTIDRNGNPLGATQDGFLCIMQDKFGNGRLYWLGNNGEARHISNLTVPPVTGSPGGKDDTRPGTTLCQQFLGLDQEGPFDGNNPNTLYCIVFTGPGNAYTVVYKATYNVNDPTWGNYREWSAGFDANAENPAMSFTNITKASLGKDLAAQMTAVVPGFNASYFPLFAGSNIKGSTYALIASRGQNTMGYYISFNVATGNINYARDSWTGNNGSPRWGVIHGGVSQETPSFGRFYIAPMVSPSSTASGRFQINLLSINGLPNTALTPTYADALTCEQLGVTNSAYISQGATGNQCILVTVSGLDAYNPSPSPTDLAAFPHPNNASTCGGDGSTSNCYAQVQKSQEGDYLQDVGGNGFGENMRLVKKITPTNWVLQRFVGWDNSTTTQSSHSAGWTPIFWPQGVTTASYYWFDANGNSILDSATMGAGHHEIFTAGTDPSTGTYVMAGYLVRTGGFPEQIGQLPNFTSLGAYSPRFAGSNAGLSIGFIQSHPSARQHLAQSNEQRWVLDGRPFGGSVGGGNQAYFNCITATPTTNVYKVSPPNDTPGCTGTVLSSLDRKRLPLHAWAGRYLLKDKSGPGSVLATGDAWNYCVADFAGECVTGSQAGDVYMNVPQADTRGICRVQFEFNSPCWNSAQPHYPWIMQVGFDKEDAAGVYWRRFSGYFSGLGWTDNFWNARPYPDASWAFTTSPWVNGLHTEILAAKLPPWPPQGERGSDFAQFTLSYPSIAGSLRRVRFGYDPNLFCTSRQEQCSTAGAAPFTWLSEPQVWTTCDGTDPCTIKVPALSGRILYYVEDFDNGLGQIRTSPMKVAAIP